MAEVKKAPESKSNMTPFVIIGLIALATVIGIYAVSQSGDDETATNTNTSAGNQADPGKAAREAYAKAPGGATPANTLGSESATVVVEEFADFQCPTCAVKHPVIKEVVNQYSGKIRFVFRHYPLTNIHQHAYDAALAAEAAGAQGKFWQMQEMLFVNQPTWSAMPNARSAFKEYAEKIGLDVAKFENDSLVGAAKTRVQADMNRGNAIGIQSTPTILINGIAVPFAQLEKAQLSQLIDAEIARVSGKTEQKDKDEAEEPASNSESK